MGTGYPDQIEALGSRMDNLSLSMFKNLSL